MEDVPVGPPGPTGAGVPVRRVCAEPVWSRAIRNASITARSRARAAVSRIIASVTHRIGGSRDVPSPTVAARLFWP